MTTAFKPLEAVVVVDQNWGIGYQGEQHIYLKQDLQHFKEITQGQTVILGRKTLATFPGGKPLKNRRNLILSRSSDFSIEGGEVFSSLESLLASLEQEETAYVIGGSQVYDLCLPLCKRVHLTQLQAEFSADCYFPQLLPEQGWQISETSSEMEEKQVKFTFLTYTKQ